MKMIIHTQPKIWILSGIFSACFSLAILLYDASVQAQNLQLQRTKVIDGFYIGVTGNDFSTNYTSVDNKLYFGIWKTKADKDTIVYLPTMPEYIYQIQLFDTNKIALPKTELGKKVGTKFANLDATFSSSKEKEVGLRIERVLNEQDWNGQYLFFPFKPGDGGRPFYAPNDLFDIKKPGVYILEIHFQIIVRTGLGFDKTAHVVRFPPLDYPLVKHL